jgi:hypothetical protein
LFPTLLFWFKAGVVSIPISFSSLFHACPINDIWGNGQKCSSNVGRGGGGGGGDARKLYRRWLLLLLLRVEEESIQLNRILTLYRVRDEQSCQGITHREYHSLGFVNSLAICVAEEPSFDIRFMSIRNKKKFKHAVVILIGPL